MGAGREEVTPGEPAETAGGRLEVYGTRTETVLVSVPVLSLRLGVCRRPSEEETGSPHSPQQQTAPASPYEMLLLLLLLGMLACGGRVARRHKPLVRERNEHVAGDHRCASGSGGVAEVGRGDCGLERFPETGSSHMGERVLVQMTNVYDVWPEGRRGRRREGHCS